MTTRTLRRLRAGASWGMAAALLFAGVGTVLAHGDPPSEDRSPGTLTNLEHLNFLGDTVAPPSQPGHSTYREDEEPDFGVLWTYADARDGGTFERVGGGPYDEDSDTWGQGAFNTDDLTRAAVVYLRHWRLTGEDDSRSRAYELLRGVTYMQTTTGEDAGNVVLWMQPDGSLNESPEPVELPDPSDSDESYWLARTVWALGEGYEAFADEDPAFAGFLEDRLELALSALERASLSRYGRYDVADGVRVPAWLIVDGADATAEAVLGLAAYVRTAPSDTVTARRAMIATERYAEGIAAMSAGEAGNWPFGSIVQWTHSRSLWHAWSSQMPAALAQAADVLDLSDPTILNAALTDAAVFTPYLLTSTGPINGWQPSPTDLTQIAYGVDSRVQSLLTLADVAGRPGLASLAGMTAAWYFGANRAGEAMYNPDTGITFDGLQADGTINRNSGAESAIHGLLSMIALDGHPEVSAAAQTMTTLDALDGVTVTEAEGGTVDGAAEVVTPDSGWTGESAWSGGAYLALSRNATATWSVAPSDQDRLVLPVIDLVTEKSVQLDFLSDDMSLGSIDPGTGGAQGVTDAPGSLVPVTLNGVLPAGATEVSVVARGAGASARLDAVLLIPVVSSLILSDGDHDTVLLHNTTDEPRTFLVDQSTTDGSGWSSYNSLGELVATGTGDAVTLQPQGFSIVGDNPAVTPTPTPTRTPSASASPTASASKPPVPTPSMDPTRTFAPTVAPRPTGSNPGLPSTGD